MTFTLIEITRALVGLVAGIAIGYGFGVMQKKARGKNEQLQNEGRLANGWLVMPGAMKRVSYLLIGLAGIQFFFPVLSIGRAPWFVSSGVVLGYGWILIKHIQHLRSLNS